MGCALALMACGGGGDDDDSGGGGTSGTTTNGGTGGMGSTTTNGGTGGMGSTTTNGGTGGKGSSGMNGGTGGKAGGTGGMGGSSGMGGAGGGTGGMVASADCSMQGAALPDGECKATAKGVYALKTELDVWWKDENNPDTPIVDPGRGKIVIYLMGSLDVCDDGKGKGVLKACGSELPAFTSDLTCDAYQLQFDDAMWDKPKMPTFTTDGMTDSFDKGGMLTISQATGLVGIHLADGAAWPTSTQTGTFMCPDNKTGLDCFEDQDDDGQPGVTLTLRHDIADYMPNNCGTGDNQPDCNCQGTGKPFTYRGSPTSLDVFAGGGMGGGVRAIEVHVGLSTTIGGAGKIGDDCMSGMGDGVAPEDAIKSRVASCKVDPASADSSRTDFDCGIDPVTGNNEAQFVDDNVPNYHVLQKGEKPPADLKYPNGKNIDPTVSPGPLSSVKRLGDIGGNFTCADARAAFK